MQYRPRLVFFAEKKMLKVKIKHNIDTTEKRRKKKKWKLHRHKITQKLQRNEIINV